MTTRRVAQVMGLPISLAVREPVPGLDAAWADVVTELRWVDHVFSTWKPDSVVSRVRRGELAVVDAPPEVAEVVALGERAGEESDGAFSVWLPDADGVRRFDPTGVVKGWAVQRASRHLTGLGGAWCLNAGGDIVCATPEGAQPWRIGVEDPRDPSRVLAVVPMTTGAVATSGTVHRGAHLLDARTGAPPTGIASVTVVAGDLTTADVAATAAYALGPQAEAWLRGRVAAGAIAHALLVTPDGERRLVA